MLLLVNTQKKHLGDLVPTVPDLPPPPNQYYQNIWKSALCATNHRILYIYAYSSHAD